MKNLKEIIEQHTNEEGAVNYDAVQEVINKNTNDIIASKTDEDKLLPKAVEKVIGELGVEGQSIDDLKLYVKKMSGNTDEFKEQNIKLEKDLEALKAERDEYAGKYDQVQNEYRTTQQMSKIKSLGVDDDRAEFLHYKLNKQVDEENDFDKVFDTYKEENAEEFRKQETTNRRVLPQSQSSGDMDINAIHEAKYGGKK